MTEPTDPPTPPTPPAPPDPPAPPTPPTPPSDPPTPPASDFDLETWAKGMEKSVGEAFKGMTGLLTDLKTVLGEPGSHPPTPPAPPGGPPSAPADPRNALQRFMFGRRRW